MEGNNHLAGVEALERWQRALCSFGILSMREVLTLYGKCTISDSQLLIGWCLRMPVNGMDF